MNDYIDTPKNGDPISGPNRALNFITCLYQRPNSIGAIEQCANLYLEPDDYRTYIEYIKLDSTEVKAAFGKMQQKTLAIAPSGLTRVPTVTVNGVVDYNAFDDLVQEACAQYSVSNSEYLCKHNT